MKHRNDRERIEETINERKKIPGISQDPHQKKKVFKENRSKSKVDAKQVLDRGL